MTSRPMDTTPDAEEFYAGLGNNFDHFFDLMAEFIDNSISNIETHKDELDHVQVHITIDEVEGELVQVKIEDTGSGIPPSKMEKAFTVGGDTGEESARNEHGFGMKHAIAAANKMNNNWCVATKTKDEANQGKYRQITAPFSFSPVEYSIQMENQPWPGYAANKMLPGTFITFRCPRTLFDTMGVRGATNFRTLIGYFREKVGYVYSVVIRDSAIPVKLSWSTLGGDGESSIDVLPVEPVWTDTFDEPSPNPSSITVDLGGGDITLDYRFGRIDQSSNHKLCYRVNTSDMGLEIRLDGRLIHDQMFSEIWNKTRNPSYNHFRAIVNLKSAGNISGIPPTLTNKTGFQQTPMFNNLLREIRELHPNPPSEYVQSTTEGKLRDDLMDMKKTHIPDPKTVSKEIPCFELHDTGVCVDLYVKHGNNLQLYECKKGKSRLLDLYQLKMYWDGSVRDGKRPTEGILVASDHPDWMSDVVGWLNGTTDGSGEVLYNFVTKTWRDEGVEWPI